MIMASSAIPTEWLQRANTPMHDEQWHRAEGSQVTSHTRGALFETSLSLRPPFFPLMLAHPLTRIGCHFRLSPSLGPFSIKGDDRIMIHTGRREKLFIPWKSRLSAAWSAGHHNITGEGGDDDVDH